MTTTNDYNHMNDRISSLLQKTIEAMGPELVGNPELAEVLNRMIDGQVDKYTEAQDGKNQENDGGLADLIGLGKDAPTDLGQTQMPPDFADYDDTIDSDRIRAAAQLYHICIHELLGVFSVVDKLQELFRAGTLRISGDEGALALYRLEKHGILRYSKRDRLMAYQRMFGYGRGYSTQSVRPNVEFHGLFKHFIIEVAEYWQQKRISEVIRHNANDPTFGSIAIVRRAALDLRNNLKNTSYGNINVLRIETNQALAECFKVLEAPDIMAQFGAKNGWETIELVKWQYFQESVQASTMNRMAVAGRDIIDWLAEPYVLKNDRTQFETLLYRIAEPVEDWISSEEGMRMTRPTPPPRDVYASNRSTGGVRRNPVYNRSNGRRPVSSE